jgi:hypothetical protein
MPETLSDWPRPYYERPGGRPLLFYAVFGTFRDIPPLSSGTYRSHGVQPGLDLQHYEMGAQPEVIDRFREGYAWDELRRDDLALAGEILRADQCLILRGELDDRGDLNYLRDSVGLVSFLLDHGGVGVYDPLILRWWSPGEWRHRLFEPGGPVPGHHVVILTSEEEETGTPRNEPLTWFHTRGMRKFGRPDFSVHDVPPRFHEGVIDLLNRFIEFQAFGGVIPEGQPIRMRGFPEGMACHHQGDPDDPDFNNVHVEITPPA